MAEYLFKTIYFPKERVKSGSPARVTVSIPMNDGLTPAFTAYVSQLSSRSLRVALGDPYLEAIEAVAQSEGRSFSNVCLRPSVTDNIVSKWLPRGRIPFNVRLWY